MAKNLSSSGLSCHVEFPKNDNSNSSEFQFTNADVESQVLVGGKSVVVILLGWAGAKDKNLAKYSDIYVNHGYIIIRCSVPINVPLSEISKYSEMANRVVNIIIDHGLENHPTFIHSFSNGGAFFYTNLIKEFSKRQPKTTFDFRGTIFDSAPFPQSIQLGSRAARAAFGTYPILGSLIAALVLIYLAMCTFVYFNLQAWDFCKDGASYVGYPNKNKYLLVSTVWLNRICNLKNHVFLFLYSDTDIVSPSDKIEMVAEYLAERGNSVSLVKFDGSEHVLHYRKFPKEYESAMITFIRETMGSNDKPTVYWDECH